MQSIENTIFQINDKILREINTKITQHLYYENDENIVELMLCLDYTDTSTVYLVSSAMIGVLFSLK